MTQKIGFVGLGKMGKNMVVRLLASDVSVVTWNRSPEPLDEVKKLGAQKANSIEELVKNLTAPRTIWLMLPARDVTNEKILEISKLLDPGDLIIDGANNFYKDTIKNAEVLESRKINFLDCGVSGGPAGARNGACLMIGGDIESFKQAEWLFKILAAPNAYAHVGEIGAGHFTKMVHNGIEYGMMQAIAEGFEVLAKSSFTIDLQKAADIYSKGSVIESRLISWLSSGFSQYGTEMKEISGSAQESGEGKWTIEAARELGVDTGVIDASLAARAKSRENPSFQGKIIQLLRNQFGGHKA